MKILSLICILIFTNSICKSQTPCEYTFKTDSCSIQNLNDKALVDLMEVKIKNNYLVQFIKNGSKNYLKIIVKDNLGYGKTSSLLIQSSKRQIYIKSITLQAINKTSGYFIFELNNTKYLQHIRDFGISNFIFNENAEFSIPNSDSEQIKKAAKCFFLNVKDTIEPPVK